MYQIASGSSARPTKGFATILHHHINNGERKSHVWKDKHNLLLPKSSSHDVSWSINASTRQFLCDLSCDRLFSYPNSLNPSMVVDL